jgi:hypothetical protein
MTLTMNEWDLLAIMLMMYGLGLLTGHLATRVQK